MKLNVGALETANDTFAVAEEPGVRVGEQITLALVERSAGAAGGTRVGVERVVVESAKYDNLFAGHEHEIFWFGSRIVDESCARADAALLKRKAGPCVEGVSVHCDETLSVKRERRMVSVGPRRERRLAVKLGNSGK